MRPTLPMWLHPPSPLIFLTPQHQCSAFEFSPHTRSHGAGQPQQRALSLLSTRPQTRGAKAFERPCAPGQRQHHGPQNFFLFLIFFFLTFSFVKQKVFVHCQEGLRQICHGPFLWLPLPTASPSLAFWPLACCNPFPAPGFSLSLPCWRASNPLPPSRRLLRGTPVSSLQLTAGFICPQGLVFIRHHAARRCGGFRPSHYPAFQH